MSKGRPKTFHKKSLHFRSSLVIKPDTNRRGSNSCLFIPKTLPAEKSINENKMTDKQGDTISNPVTKINAENESFRPRTGSKTGKKRPLVDYEDSDSNSRCSSQSSVNFNRTSQEQLSSNLEPITEIGSGTFGEQSFKNFEIDDESREEILECSSPITSDQNSAKVLKLDLSFPEDINFGGDEDFSLLEDTGLLDDTGFYGSTSSDPYQQSLQFVFAKSTQVLGNGASGCVKKVFDNDQFYAIKQIQYDANAKQQNILNNAKHEISILRKIMDGPDENSDKKHIIQMISYDLEDLEAVYIKLELCDVSLSGMMNSGNFAIMNTVWTARWGLPSPGFTGEDFCYFPIDDVRLFAGQILKGLAFLHENDIVHRDIKCDNLLLTGLQDGWVVKIADFGHSRVVEDQSGMFTPTGTPSHMSPEIMSLSSQILPSSESTIYVENLPLLLVSDIWSLGCALTELSTGSTPHFITANRPHARDMLLYNILRDKSDKTNSTLSKAKSQIKKSYTESSDRHSLINLVSDCLEMEYQNRKSAMLLLDHYSELFEDEDEESSENSQNEMHD